MASIPVYDKTGKEVGKYEMAILVEASSAH